MSPQEFWYADAIFKKCFVVKGNREANYILLKSGVQMSLNPTWNLRNPAYISEMPNMPVIRELRRKISENWLKSLDIRQKIPKIL